MRQGIGIIGIVTLLVFIALCAGIAHAFCIQDGCGGLEYAEGFKFEIFGNSFPNYYSSQNYTTCDIGPTKFEPVFYDYDGDLTTEIIKVESDTTVGVYSSGCNNEEYIGVAANERIMTQPIVAPGMDSLYILTNLSIYRIDFNTGIPHSLAHADNIEEFGCYDNYCFGFSRLNSSFYVFDFLADTVTNYSVLSSNDGLASEGNASVNMIVNNGAYMAVFCSVHSSLNRDKIYCDMLNDTGAKAWTATIDTGTQDIVSVQERNAYFFKIANTWRINIFMSVTNALGAKIDINRVYDLSGNLIKDFMTTFSQVNTSSPLMVGQYHKDGVIEACRIQNLSTIGEQWLYCYKDTQFVNVHDSVEVTDIIPPARQYFMADYDFNESTLGFANYLGIFYPDNVTRLDTSSYSSSNHFHLLCDQDIINVVEVNSSLSAIAGVPMCLLASTSGLLEYSDRLITVLCGNGICDGSENAVTCPADCGATSGLNNTGAVCRRDSDCVTGQCDYGFCQLATGGKSCTSGTTCISGTCSAGRCTKASLMELITAGKNEQFGDDSDTNDFISMILIFVIAAIFAVVGFRAGHAAMGIGIAYVWVLASTIFFAKVGWLSGIIAFLVIIGSIVMGILALLVARSVMSRG